VLLEGMAICAYAVGAKHGIVFIRSEYPQAIQSVSRAIEEAKEAGALGDFDVWVFPALGSYVCGEETALLNTLEGLRGEVRLRPPYPAVEGLYGRPTVVNNIETLAAIPWIIQNGGQAFQTMGTRESSGTKVLCFDHAFAKPGVVEVEFGHSLAEVIQENALGGNAGKELEAVLLGGPMGSIIEIEKWDVPICYGEMRKAGIELGHGGVVGLLQGFDPSALLLHHLEFMKDESCGKCVPCKLGSARGLELAHQIPNASSIRKLRDLFDLMRRGSLCAFGQLMPGAMKFLLHRVEEDSNV
jgi:NADH:ubiquinone oxidoreductase subunit F (NADH-binding)